MTHRTIHIRGWRVDVFIEDGYHPDAAFLLAADICALGCPCRGKEDKTWH